ncbi:MAG: tripartite tricarboxylate transporter substrate binding protein [Burkholderiales bacterium]|nr:tripartite tricarboxylate transporter substrate binding protein [Burkholderiales bacterium]
MASAVALAALSAASTLHAQGYPVRPIRIINTSAAGGPAELVARIVGQKLTEAWGQQAVVDSRGGAGGIIGAEIASRASPDGYTLLLGSGATMVFAPLLQPNIQYDPLKDFAHVSMVVLSPFVLVAHPSLGVKTVSDMVALAKAKPRQLNFGMLGVGSTSHLGIELLKIHSGIEVQQVAYKGGAPAATALVAGEIHLLFNSLASALPHVKAGRLTLLATAGPRRSPLIPEAPTVAETYPGVEVVTWYSVLAPAKTPADIVAKLNGEIRRALANREVIDRLVQQGHEPHASSPQEMRDYMRRELEKWGKIIKTAGVKTQS